MSKWKLCKGLLYLIVAMALLNAWLLMRYPGALQRAMSRPTTTSAPAK